MKNFKNNKKFSNKTKFVFSSEFVGFTTVPNFILNDERISYKALGIYCKILQFQNSPNHSLYQKTLSNLKTDGKASVSSGIKELIKYGYLSKRQLKDENGLYCGIEYTVYMKPNKVKENPKDTIASSENRFSDNRKKDTKNKIFNNKIFNNNKSVIENSKKEMTDRQTKHKQNFKIEIESNKKLNNIVVDIANDLLANEKTVKIKNKRISINSIIYELKKLTKENLLKLINYVAEKFEYNNNNNIKNKVKYIASIFVNTIFEKGYLLNDFKNNKQNTYANKTYGKNRFVNYKQEPLDYDVLRQIEKSNLIIENEEDNKKINNFLQLRGIYL